MFNIQYSIYKLLKEAQQDDDVLKHFNIQFPNRRIAESSNSIFIGLSEARADERTHQSQFYEELIDIIIVTKQKKYFEASKIYDAVTNIILRILRESDLYEDRLNWTSFKHQYNPQTNELQLSELLISIRNDEQFNQDLQDDMKDFNVDISGIIEAYTDEEPYSYIEQVTGFVKNESGTYECILIPPKHLGDTDIIIQPGNTTELQVGTYTCIIMGNEFNVRVNHDKVSRVSEL